MLKQILKFIVETLILPITNYFLKKDTAKIDTGIDYLNDLILILEKLRNGLQDKEITQDEIVEIHSEVIKLIGKIKDVL